MGTDIHLYVEKRAPDGSWEHLPSPREKTEDMLWWHSEVPWYWHRRYVLFSVLAGVRDQGTFVISLPRGLPEDVSRYVCEEATWWGSEAHSHSWLLLEELQAFDWDGVLKSLRYRDYVGSAWFDFMEELAGLDSPLNVRIVFWFDD